ncbi:MAG: peptide ABC transporter substrate-binding protein [Actinobacteria bacterium]|nr:peptide ABC transporter substrate-binding protein [Actinomycetota bacterium]
MTVRAGTSRTGTWRAGRVLAAAVALAALVGLVAACSGGSTGNSPGGSTGSGTSGSGTSGGSGTSADNGTSGSETTGGGSSSAAPIKEGGTLRIGVTAEIDTLNPFSSQSDYSSVAYQYLYPHLTVYDEKLNLAPSFAESWADSDGGKVWTFKTVPNAKWSDGAPLTAKDAAFTLNMIVKYQDGPTGQLSQLVTGLKTATATDDNTLVLTYSDPTANVPAQMQGVHILPEQVWGKLATGNGDAIRTFANDATPSVSGGPFQLVKYTQNQIALFARNANWWGQKPHIDGFGIQMFGTADAMAAALKSGQLDMIGESTSPTLVESLKQAGMVVSTGPSQTFYDLIINTNPKMKAHKELLNPKVREAFEYALDRAQMISKAWLGFAENNASIVSTASGWSDPAIKPLPFDLAKANQLLDEAGFKKGADGIRMGDGAPMSYNLIFPTEINGAGDVMFDIIKNDFQQIGVQVTQQKMDPTAATTAINGADNKYEDYTLAMWDWVLPPDPQNVLGVLTCDQWGNNSDSGYCNPEYDKLFAQQGTLVDRAARQAAVNQMQEMIFKDRPYIVLCYPDVIEAHSPKWDGFVMSPLLGSVNNLSIATLLNVHQVS